MSFDQTVLVILIGAGLVTWVPRIIPFVFASERPLPPIVSLWLSFVPVCIFTALVVDSLLSNEGGALTLDPLALVALIPTAIVAYVTRSLSWTVIIGIVAVASLRFFFA